jgi:hypothetical protein
MASNCAFMLKDAVTAIGGLLNARLEKSASAAPLTGRNLVIFYPNRIEALDWLAFGPVVPARSVPRANEHSNVAALRPFQLSAVNSASW